MRQFFYTLIIFLSFLIIENNTSLLIGSDDIIEERDIEKKEEIYTYPQFYRGIYLNVVSARKFDRLKNFVEQAKKAGINTFVMDVQSSKYQKCIVPREHVQYCIDNGIHPIARIVVFPEGLKYHPVPMSIIQDKMDIAESACLSGFKELQFDYIRFNDSSRLKHLTRQQRYDFIEGLLAKLKNSVKKYNVKVAADIFGRIPLNSGDIIGQRMEGLDRVVDIICPMAYPSHYTWSKKLQNDPYYTVYITSKKADERTRNAEIVTYIQAFKIKIGSMAYDKYIREQVKAVHDSGVRGYILWNARQEYDIPFQVTRKYYSDSIIITEDEKKDFNDKS